MLFLYCSLTLPDVLFPPVQAPACGQPNTKHESDSPSMTDRPACSPSEAHDCSQATPTHEAVGCHARPPFRLLGGHLTGMGQMEQMVKTAAIAAGFSLCMEK